MNRSLRTVILNRIRLLFRFYPLDTCIAFFTRKLECLSVLKKMLPNNYQYKKGSWRNLTRDGINFRVDLSDYIDWKLYFSTWSKDRKVLFSLIKKGDVVYDIGTHKGALLLYLARAVGASGSLVGFEAFPETYGYCKNNISLNPQMTQIQLYHAAIGDKNAHITMEKPASSNTSGNRVVKNVTKGGEIREVTLDQFLLDHPEIQPPKLIKIMTNGYELHGLRGARNTILKFKPILFLELGDDNLKAQGDSGKELLKFLEEAGYRSHKVLGDVPLYSKDDFSNMVFDFVSYPIK